MNTGSQRVSLPSIGSVTSCFTGQKAQRFRVTSQSLWPLFHLRRNNEGIRSHQFADLEINQIQAAKNALLAHALFLSAHKPMVQCRWPFRIAGIARSQGIAVGIVPLPGSTSRTRPCKAYSIFAHGRNGVDRQLAEVQSTTEQGSLSRHVQGPEGCANPVDNSYRKCGRTVSTAFGHCQKNKGTQ